jgi:zinc protease
MHETHPRPRLRHPILAAAIACALVFGGVPAVSFAADGIAPPKGVAAGPCVEGVCEYTLGNGLRVLLFPDTSKPTVTVNIAYNVGSVHENYGETGMAHLLEHLMFKGTPKNTDIDGEMKKRGIEKNASTWFDRTNYYATFPVNDESLEWVLQLEADRMLNSFIAKKDLDSEMTVVRNEMERNESAPIGVLLDRMRSTAFLWHNYGNTTIGARSDVEKVPIERLQNFYKTWYRPDNATLIVAGKIDPSATLVRIQKHFGGLKRPAKTLPTFYTEEPTQDGEREVTVRRSGDVRFIGTSYRIPGATHPDNAALAVLLNALTDTPGGRLHKALVDAKLAAGVGGFSDNVRTSGLATLVLAAPKDTDIDKSEREFLRQIEDIAKTPLSSDEVAQAKQRIANGYEAGFNDVNSVAMDLTESVSLGDWRMYFLKRDRIAAVTVDDVNRVARTYFKRSNRTLGRFVPTDGIDRAEIAAAPSAAEALKGYAGKASIAAGEAFDPTPANIDARTQTFSIGDGLKVSLMPKDNRGDSVVVRASFQFANEAALKGRSSQAGYLAGSMLMRGSNTMNREQIAQRLEALKTTGGVGGGSRGAYIQLQTKRDQLADALALAVGVLRNPAFPESEFEQLRLQSITGLEAGRTEPGTVAWMATEDHFDPWPAGHPLEHKSMEQGLAEMRAMKLEDVIAYYRDFYGFAEGQIVVIGDFDAAAIKAQLQTLFSDARNPARYAPIPTHYTDVPAKRSKLETPDKSNAVLVARSNLSLNQNDADYPALVIANHILNGEDSFKSRLGHRLREKEGLTYGVNSALYADESREGREDAGYLFIQALVAPENADKLEAAMREELVRFVKDGVTAEELKAAVDGKLVERRQQRASDDFLAGTLISNLEHKRTMAWSADFDVKLKALTLDEVNAVIRKHFKPETLSVFMAGDFAKAAAKAETAGK